eukprot:6534279-Prymnesium_polylepis.1
MPWHIDLGTRYARSCLRTVPRFNGRRSGGPAVCSRALREECAEKVASETAVMVGTRAVSVVGKRA